MTALRDIGKFLIGNLMPDAKQTPIHRGAGSHGSAALFNEAQQDLVPEFAAAGSTSIVLGIDEPGATKGAAWTPSELQGHALTFGATRSGKGVSVIIPTLLIYRGSVLVVDPKAEAVWVCADRRRQMGQRVVILDPWDETNRRYARGPDQAETVTRFNPLSAIDPASRDFADDIASIADALIVADTSGGMSSHWTDSARELVSGLVAAAVEATPGKASLRHIRKLLTGSDEDLAAEIDRLVKANPNSLAARKLRRFTRDSQEISGIRSTAETQTAILDSRTLLDAMETNEPPFELDELADRPTTIFLVLPPDRLVTHGRWLRLVLTLALRTISRRQKPPPVPVLLMLDEAGSSLGPLQSVESAFGLLAGLGVRLWMFLQDLNQLQRDYPRSWETFVANASVIQVLTARDGTTSRYFSEYLGQSTEIIGAQPGRGNPWIKNSRITPATPGSPMGRPVMFPNEVREIDKDKLLVLYPGLFSTLVYKVRYYEHPAFKGRFRPLPGH